MSNRAFITAIVLLLLSGALSSWVASRPMPVVVATNLEKIPMEIDGYRAVEDSFPESVYKALNADKHVYRHYRSADGSDIDLYIGYYGTAKGGRTGHNPYACLPGAGAAIVDTGMVTLHPSILQKDVAVNYIQSRKDGIDTVMLHWYQTAGKIVLATGVRQNVERFLGRAINNRSDGAFIRLTSTVVGGDVTKAKGRIEKFAQSILKVLPNYWPNER